MSPMFSPKFTYTDKLVNNIALIKELSGGLAARQFPSIVLHEFTREARALSSYSSTAIEGNPLPLTVVKQILKTKPRNIRDAEKEVLNYNNALLYLDEQIQHHKVSTISRQLVCEVQAMVTTGLLPRSQRGKYRNQAVFVNDPIIRKTVCWPPDYQDVSGLISELLDFMDDDERNLDCVILAGIFHQQFVIIHPFLDGNGRTVRLLTNLLMARLGLNTFRLFSFENYYNAAVSKYFEMIVLKGNYYDVYQNWDFTPWLEYFSTGIVDELQRVSKLLTETTSRRFRLQGHEKTILEFLDAYGMITAADYAKLTNRSKASRILDFGKLVEMKLIERKGEGRGVYYVLPN